MISPQAPMCLKHLRLTSDQPSRAVSDAERPAVEAALAQAAEQYNRGACDLEAFVMRMVAVSGRDAVFESLHAVGYGSQVPSRLSGCPCLRARRA